MGKYGTITLQESGKFPRNGGTRPLNPNQDNKNNKGGQGPKKRGFFVGALVWALVLVIIFNFIAGEIANAGTKEVTYSEFIQMVENNEVATAELANKQITFYLSKDLPAEITQPSGQSSDQDLAKVLAEQMEKGGATCYITAPPQGQGYRDDDLLPVLKQHNVAYAFTMEKETSLLMNMLLSYVLPVVIMTGALIFIMRRMGGPGGLGGVGKSNAKVYMEKSTGVTFADVAGQDEAKESLEEIIDFLHNPGKYTEIGAKLPKGALLVGPPGTGKTLLAKAVAGEAGVPFFSISGSDFVEMFVGVGASRVRDLFDQAKRAAPSIIFIDEIDAVGRHRGAGLGGGHDEREQTLNQLLVEMDGFAINEGVIVMAATNRRDILDPALLRPGRFDRTILVNYPDMAGRVAILKVHAKGKPLADDVDLENIAKRVPFSTGAELENIMNEAAILAARGRLKAINQQTLVEAISRVQMGPEKRSHKVTQRDKRMVAIHEAGHAIVGHVLPNCDEVHLITIVPRGQAGGYTLSLPTEEDDLQTYSQLMDFVAMGLGGHAAEQLYLGEFTTGATSDLKKATEVCRRMVTQFGMSEKLGPVYLDGDQEVFVGMEFGQSRGYSEEMAARIDAEVKRLLEECYQKAVDALSANRDRMEKLVDALLKYDTISRREFVTLMETGALPDIQDADTRTTGDVMMQDMADEKKKENSEKSAETPEKSAETPEKTADAPENHPDAPHEA